MSGKRTDGDKTYLWLKFKWMSTIVGKQNKIIQNGLQENEENSLRNNGWKENVRTRNVNSEESWNATKLRTESKTIKNSKNQNKIKKTQSIFLYIIRTWHLQTLTFKDFLTTSTRFQGGYVSPESVGFGPLPLLPSSPNTAQLKLFMLI